MKAWIAHRTNTLRRIFSLWVLLALFLCASIGLVAVNAVLMFGLIRSHISEVCSAARGAYEQGGPEPLRLVLRGAEIGPGIRVHLLDSTGVDLVTGQHLSALISGAQPDPLSARASQPAVTVKSGAYSCVAEPPPRPPPIPLGPMLWVLPFVSALCCSVGAYVTWRMRRIETVVNHFGSGELAVRMNPDSGDSIGRLARAFNQMAERIESLVSSHQSLCADMAHELRAPLTRLLLAIPAARRGASGALDRVETEASRVNDLVDELLEVARAEVNSTALQLEPLDLEMLLTEIADHCAIEALDRGCEIQLFLSQAGTLIGDVDLLRRAIENVLRNAVQHTPEGTRIHVSSQGDDDFATIAIRDWGPGVPDPALAEIFRPFYRVDAGRGRTTGGVGLGLAIAQRAIAVHRGTIRADNCRPGLCVTIRLPRHPFSGGGPKGTTAPSQRPA
jgi:two-component system sensor histidine kinase CpxA